MPADMNDYFKKKKPGMNQNKPSGNGGGNSGGGNGGGFNNPMDNLGKGAPILIGIVILAFALITLKPFTIINSGEVGIKIRTGKFDDTPLQPGLHFYIPVLQKVMPVNTRVRLITYSNNRTSAVGDNYASGAFEGGLKRNPAIQVLAHRGLTVNIDLAVLYSIRAESAPKTIETWGDSWEEKIINSKVREVVRDVIGQYTAEQLPTMRNEIASAIQTKVT
ncbi:MAG TPA: prohibitin family protein, partial [Epsilonproteobacteria bacterium]|nr:prohibitin family protein [Campylobacterota bacterium]